MDDKDTLIISNTETGVQELSEQTAREKKDIESAVMDGKDTLISTTDTGVRKMSEYTASGKQCRFNIKHSGIYARTDRIDSKRET
ncbi:hypothetical protein DPMN_140742 [Dreissena polymorpha]|uniref:Uncharacterized protein n=1 Tax=Dreissena polymorpha TaxID=45954 RepID=A0A9D4JKM9_DREPO|nr:hypothetical protein DPMN_140742 [Dreissena polymorpha]